MGIACGMMEVRRNAFQNMYKQLFALLVTWSSHELSAQSPLLSSRCLHCVSHAVHRMHLMRAMQGELSSPCLGPNGGDYSPLPRCVSPCGFLHHLIECFVLHCLCWKGYQPVMKVQVESAEASAVVDPAEYVMIISNQEPQLIFLFPRTFCHAPAKLKRMNMLVVANVNMSVIPGTGSQDGDDALLLSRKAATRACVQEFCVLSETYPTSMYRSQPWLLPMAVGPS